MLPFVTDAGNFVLPFVVAAIIIIVVGRVRGLRFLVLAVVSVVVADAMGTHLFKYSFLRARPCIALADVRLLVGCTNLPSFPSNHAVNASVLATLTTLHMPRLWLPAAALAFLVGYSRVYVGVHYPLDVLAGSLLGIAVAVAFSGAMNFLWPLSTEPAKRRRIFPRQDGGLLEAHGTTVDRGHGTITMAESLRPKFSHMALMRRLQPGIGTWHLSAPGLDRIIDGAIVVFLALLGGIHHRGAGGHPGGAGRLACQAGARTKQPGASTCRCFCRWRHFTWRPSSPLRQRRTHG